MERYKPSVFWIKLATGYFINCIKTMNTATKG